MRRALLLCSGLAILAGCGDTSERAYYRSRYVPTSSETAYSAAERSKWKGDLTVYELPAAPPDLDGEALARGECERPGPKMKPQPVVGLHGEVAGTQYVALQEAGGMDKRPVPVGALGPLPGYVAGIQRGPDVGGIEPPNFYTKAGDWDSRPPTSGINVRTPPVVGVMRDQDKTDYCLPTETPKAAAPAR